MGKGGNMKIVFFGTPNYVIPIIENLHKEFKERSESPISAVVTQEPKLSGRNQEKTFSPVDTWAFQRKKPVFFNPMDIVRENIPADIGVLASFGKIIPEAVIKHFRYGIVNIHPSLLPLWRGSSPIQASILSGEKITGVTFMKLDPLLDHGPVISSFKEEINDADNSESLRYRLFERAAEVLTGLIPAYINGKVKLKPQDHEKATFTKQLTKEDGHIASDILNLLINNKEEKPIDINIPWMKVDGKPIAVASTPTNIFNFIRSMYPWPEAWTTVNIKGQKLRLKLLKSHLSHSVQDVTVKKLIIDEVQLEGKSPVSWKQFLEGYPQTSF